MQKLERRPVEQSVVVAYCDRCGNEIPTKRNGNGGLNLQEGADLSARSGAGWVPLIPVTAASDARHGSEFNAAHVDVCGRCLEGLQEWFAASNQDREPS